MDWKVTRFENGDELKKKRDKFQESGLTFASCGEMRTVVLEPNDVDSTSILATLTIGDYVENWIVAVQTKDE